MTDEARLEELAKLMSNHPFLGMAVDEINSLEAHNAELREQVQSLRTLNGDLAKARDRAVARLREEEDARAWERSQGEELVMLKSHEIGELERALARLENWLEVTAAYAMSKPKRDYAKSTLKKNYKQYKDVV